MWSKENIYFSSKRNINILTSTSVISIYLFAYTYIHNKRSKKYPRVQHNLSMNESSRVLKKRMYNLVNLHFLLLWYFPLKSIKVLSIRMNILFNNWRSKDSISSYIQGHLCFTNISLSILFFESTFCSLFFLKKNFIIIIKYFIFDKSCDS